MDAVQGLELLSNWGVLGIMLVYFIYLSKKQAEDVSQKAQELQQEYRDREKELSARLTQLEDCYRKELVEVIRENTQVIGQNVAVMQTVSDTISLCSAVHAHQESKLQG